MAPFSDEITHLLVRWGKGDDAAFNELVPLFYQHLHRLAAHYMRGERADHTLQTTALVHEAYIELRGWRNFNWVNRAQFVGIAANMMRRILSDYARKHGADKRGGGAHPISITKAENVAREPGLDLVAIDEALTKLERLYPLSFRVVELKFYAGLSTEEMSDVLGVSTSTVERGWKFGKAWLHDQIAGPK